MPPLTRLSADGEQRPAPAPGGAWASQRSSGERWDAQPSGEPAAAGGRRQPLATRGLPSVPPASVGTPAPRASQLPPVTG